jgi:hypothetical protein
MLLLGLAAASSLGCDRQPEPLPPQPQQPPAPKPMVTSQAAATSATQTAAAKPGNLSWQKPAAWKNVDHPSRMRKATYEIPGADGGAAATLSVTRVGGSIDANIARWRGQFDANPKASRTQRKANGVTIHVVSIGGTFKGGGMPGMAATEPKKDWAMLAAVAEADRANFFFKMTGPKKTVDAARGDFDVLLGSITPDG